MTGAGPGAAAPDGRRAELAGNLTALQDRIGAACAAAARDAGEITLIAVTKTFPASDVRLLSELGVRHVGENRDQEAAPKAAECQALGLPLTWHFVGQLQVNKVKSVVSYADVIQSVDRARLVDAIAARARAAERTVSCLIQVSLDGEAGRGGARPDEVAALADAVADRDGLVLGGVMAVAPLGAPPAPAFARLREVAARVRAAHPGATVISAGMTADLEEAIAAGATHLRIGTALLGGRRAFVR